MRARSARAGLSVHTYITGVMCITGRVFSMQPYRDPMWVTYQLALAWVPMYPSFNACLIVYQHPVQILSETRELEC